MSKHAQLVEAVCALLVNRELKARDLTRLLAEGGITIDRSELNSTLYRVKDQTPGLSVATDGVWRFVPPATTKFPPKPAAQPAPRPSAVNLPRQPAAMPRPAGDPASKGSLAARIESDRAVAATAIAPTSPSGSCDPVASRAAGGGSPPGPPLAVKTPPAPAPPFERSPEQGEIIDAAASKWILVEAGPGAGKTAVALARVARLLDQGVPPSRILMVSFTRTAITEFRQRIEVLAKNVAAAAAVRITTLDSEAWNLGISFGDGAAGDKLARGFDGNIDEAIALFKVDAPALCEWMAQTHHVIIDEAQDLVGRRAELVFQILDHLTQNCGATVFVDPAQAIYGFADDESDEDHKQHSPRARPFHEQLLDNFPGQFEKRCLTKLYRSSIPTLQEVFAQGRATVLGNENAARRFAQLQELARALCEPAGAVDMRSEFDPDELVLFRRRSEVLLASSYLAKNGVPHRIRMASTCLGAQPWLASLFATEPANIISREEFERRLRLGGASPAPRSLEREQVWSLLRRLVPTEDGTAINLRTLRRQLARSRPPVELCQTEVGVSGPVIGTIHASKGREANTVSLMLPRDNGLHEADDLDAEARVTYVGCTRARHELFVGTGYAGGGFKALGRGGRVFREVHTKGNGSCRAQVELGRPGDVDELSVVAKDRLTADDARRGQAYLAAYAGQVVPLKVEADVDFRYVIRADDDAAGIVLGALTETINKDLFSIAKAIDPETPRRPPKAIPFVSLISVRAFAIADDHPRLAELHEPWATTGIFFVPVIRALTTLFLPPRRR